MKITVLAENTSFSSDFESEHGLSLYIETDTHHILFDMGQSDLFTKNAQKLGIDLSSVDFAVLSHGHYDHGGGMSYFLNINSTAIIYANKYVFEPHFNGTEKYIGLNTELTTENRIHFTEDYAELDKDIHLYSCNANDRIYPLETFGLNVLQNKTLLPEDFRHEQYMLLEENGKRILFSGCSHKGILDIVNWFKPDVLVGGFHYSKIPLNDSLENAAKILGSFPVSYYTCHCTGVEQFKFMKQYVKNLHYISTGQVFTV